MTKGRRLLLSCFSVLASVRSLAMRAPVERIPAKQALNSFFNSAKHGENATSKEFSVLSWNILLPNSKDNWWNHKMYAPSVPMAKRGWAHRRALIREKLLVSGADVICIQEADGDTFDEDFTFMAEAGYHHCLHKKFRFRCATFYKADKFVVLDQQVAHKDRTLVTTIQTIGENPRNLNVINCHLSGGAAPERRLRQIYEALEQVRKWRAKAVAQLLSQQNSNRPSPRNIQRAEENLKLLEDAGTIVCGDFNSDGNTGVRQLLVEQSVDPGWREPQYPDVPLTSKRKESDRAFVDAAELAYGANVCDGDYGEDPTPGSRPATYVVPDLASLLLLPVSGETIMRTQFGKQVAKRLAETLGLYHFSKSEVVRAFESIDIDSNDLIDQDEVQGLLESVYSATHGRQPTEDDTQKFYGDFYSSNSGTQVGLSREQLAERLMALQQELEGGSEGAELVEIRSEADAQRMVDRFSPELKAGLDKVFDFYSDSGEALTEDEVSKFLVKVNGKLGRGGTSRSSAAIFLKKRGSSEADVLTRQEWYGMFARELGEGKWWQVVYDLEVCGVHLRPKQGGKGGHYQGWLDYVYFDSLMLTCTGLQDALTSREMSLVYNDGDVFPNEWHPSDHLPVAALLSWKSSAIHRANPGDCFNHVKDFHL
mmetsp:Transcript_56687/g.111961  ORF Transcript_56687/g.111961 Transcript_56687/m.111961 type:complete len:652 (-) Transcript_56687:310-2265(-)